MMGTKRLLVAATVVAALAASASPAAASHSWGGYHWARASNPFTVSLGDNVSSAWDSYLRTAAADWSDDAGGNPLNATTVAGSTTGRKCRARSGRVEVCNAAYGNNGWLGVASVWASGGHISQATVKLNDTYYATAKYNTPVWRAAVTCQELGHTFGLDHQDESGADFHTCMDYAATPDADNTRPNAHDYEQLGLIYEHLDPFTTIGATSTATGRGRGLKRVKESLYVEDLGGGTKRYVWVVWKDNGRHAEPPADID